ncbi:MAG TPA: radical SAM protein [Ktedonosporobacter sp.]|nr:radical SAM protein [Ktedonosporobacter sp.]
MNIWLDTSPGSHDESSECDGDCGDCPKPSRPACVSWPIGVDEPGSLREVALQHAPELYIQPCGHERWLVCHPTGSGHIAVFDEAAMALFSLFATSATISQVARTFAHLSRESIEQVVGLFYCSGFLHDSAQPPPIHKQEASQTLTAWLHVTNQCNLGCHYCYVDKTAEPMYPDVGRRAIDALFRSARKHHMRHIKLKYAGGEASLQMRGVIELHSYAQQLAQEHSIHLSAHILSNGVALSSRTIERLKAACIAVTLSLDGVNSEHDSQRPMLNGHGSAQYVLRTIDRLLENKMVPYISVTVSRRNLTGLPDLMHYLLERELPFSLNYYRENAYASHIEGLRFTDEPIIAAMRAAFAVIEEHLPARRLLRSLLDKADMTVSHQRTCGVGQNYLVIDQRGGVAKCQMEIKRTITTIEMPDPLQMIREDNRGVQGLAVEAKEGCRSCQWRAWCTGGCPVQTYQSTGRYDVKSPNCNIYKALFPEVLRLEALRLMRYQKPLVVNSA